MKETPGSSPLTAEQQEFYERRFGVKYFAVQSTPYMVDENRKVHLRASRAERRKLSRKEK